LYCLIRNLTLNQRVPASSLVRPSSGRSVALCSNRDVGTPFAPTLPVPGHGPAVFILPKIYSSRETALAGWQPPAKKLPRRRRQPEPAELEPIEVEPPPPQSVPIDEHAFTGDGRCVLEVTEEMDMLDVVRAIHQIGAAQVALVRADREQQEHAERQDLEDLADVARSWSP
jgi:hypothetical protein